MGCSSSSGDCSADTTTPRPGRTPSRSNVASRRGPGSGDGRMPQRHLPEEYGLPPWTSGRAPGLGLRLTGPARLGRCPRCLAVRAAYERRGVRPTWMALAPGSHPPLAYPRRRLRARRERSTRIRATRGPANSRHSLGDRRACRCREPGLCTPGCRRSPDARARRSEMGRAARAATQRCPPLRAVAASEMRRFEGALRMADARTAEDRTSPFSVPREPPATSVSHGPRPPRAARPLPSSPSAPVCIRGRRPQAL